MANILDKYGIKEVADVTFYAIDKTTGNPSYPVLYLDTLKVSTIEQTAESVDARGGKGNPALVSWDYGKEINVTLEDALFSAKSMAIMFGSGKIDSASQTIMHTFTWTPTTDTTEAPTTTEINGKKYAFETNSVSVYEAGSTVSTATFSTSKQYFVTGTIAATANSVSVIEINANTFPGTYYITGDTYARSEISGTDEYFQFIIPKAKVSAENTITLEAEGDPSVFNLNLRVLKPTSGPMMKLVKYDLTEVVG